MHYIDTCSLKWRYLNGPASSEIDSLMNDSNERVVTSEYSLLEWSSALASVFRTGLIDREAYKRNELGLMLDILKSKLHIVALMPRIVERARYLIEYVGVEAKLALRTGDSVQLVHAMQAAKQGSQVLPFVTCDKRLAHLISSLDIFSDVIQARYIVP